MAELGAAYIEVRADLKKFPTELRTKLVAALKTAVAGVEFKELGDKAEKAGEQAAERAGKGFAKKGEQELKKGAEKAGKGLLGKLIGFFDSRRGNDSGSLFGAISGAISGGISDGLKNGQQAFKTVSDIGSKIGDIGGSIGSALKIGAIILLIPIAIQLAGALVQLGAALFALPAAIGVVGAAIAPLVIGFQGMGEAIGAGLAGDTEKFNEALKKLSPSARAVAKEFVKLGPVLKTLKTTVQEALLQPLVGQVGPALQTFLKSITPGLAQVAHALGELGATLLSYLSDKEVLGDLNDLFATTARIVDDLAPSLGKLFGSFFGLIQTGLPFVERFFGAVGDGIDSLVAWLARIQGDGTLTGWLEKAWDVGKQLFRTVKELGEYLLTLLGGEVGDQGREFLKGLADEFERLNAYLKTKEGQEAIHNLTTVLKAFGAVVLFFIRTEPAMLNGFNAVFEGTRKVLRGLELLGGGFVGLIKAIGGFLVTAGKAIGTFFTETIPRWFSNVIDFFKALPGEFLDAVLSIQEVVVAGFIAFLGKVRDTVLQGIGVVVGFFLAMPDLIRAGLNAVLDEIIGKFVAVWEIAKATFRAGLDGTIEILNGVPDAISGALSAIGSFFSDFWHGTVADIQSIVEGGFNRVVDFFSSIPDRITSLGPKVSSAARSIGHRIGEALSDVGDFASDLGKKVYNALKSSLNRAISGINSGIQLVDDKLPGTLPRIPALARGDIINRPTLALVGEAGPEVVVPLTNRQRAQELARESGLVDLLKMGRPSNAVQVVVYLDPSGVIVPTVRTVVNGELDNQGDELAYGTRDA